MAAAVATLNAGSSSLKFAVYEITGSHGLKLATKGQIEGIGTAPHLVAHDEAGNTVAERRWPEGGSIGHEQLLDAVLSDIESARGGARLCAVGHRIVHGGAEFAAPIRLTPETIEKLEGLTPLAPLHQPHNLAAVRAVAAARPQLPQVACFDTAFHRTMPRNAQLFGLPRSFADQGVLRYGFHGLSYEYIAGRLGEVAPLLRRVVIAHLGNGASLCALAEGSSVDTTMSFTPLDGLVMGTRCGALDPGVIFYLLQHHGMDAAAAEDLLYHRSGLLGISGLSSDMRTLLASTAPEAREAVDLFVFRVAREIGALAASLGGLDGIVFTAGIGENAPAIRDAVCARLAWLGVALDPIANASGAERIDARWINAAGSRVAVLAIATDEEIMIARHTLATLDRDPA
ncbi:MAG: acetate/propionate family kinase [Alphaproteobacteria bacterium]|nr:acetate/propionate family kinase [Alphaproteobacteria bacterium]MBV9863448.1 acetate/propionate family kinase [Alphaproteobacteria bacterium]